MIVGIIFFEEGWLYIIDDIYLLIYCLFRCKFLKLMKYIVLLVFDKRLLFFCILIVII